MIKFPRGKSKTPTTTEGNRKSHNRSCCTSSVSGSLFCSHGITKDDSLKFEMRTNSLEQALGTPMKNLLVEELSKENEAKRRSPSVIGRLMGLDGTMSPYNYEENSYRKNSKERHKFKDVYEDLEASHVINCRFSNYSGPSYKDSLLKYLEEQESLHSRSLCSHTAGINPTNKNDEDFEASSKGWKSEIGTISGSHRRDRHLSSALESSEPEEEKSLPRNIVVLKPSVWKLCDDVKAISSSGTILRDDLLDRNVSDHRSREKREVAKEITRQMKEALLSGRVTSPFSEIRGRDWSSFNMSEIKSDTWSNKDTSLSGLAESSVIQEAKKRLSARWRNTRNKSRSNHVVGKASTLGEMLAIPESETKAGVLDDKVELDRRQMCEALARYSGGPASERSLLGISNKDGRKNEYIRCSIRRRSRSLPPLGHETHGLHEAGGSPMAKEDVRKGRSRDVNPISDMSSSCMSSITNNEQEILNVSSASLGAWHPMLTSDDSAPNPEETNSQGPSEGISVEPSTESSENSKEADNQSPISVLEDSSSKEVSSTSDCFGSVSSRLQELRMQLQLLRLESQANTESYWKEDGWPGLVTDSQENWETSYIADLLIESGFNYTEPHMLTRTWYSPNCPLGPWVFNNLEDKYTDESIGQKHERKLLFDRVNSALVEIFQPLVKPSTVTVGLQWLENGIESEINNVLERQEYETYIKSTEKKIRVTDETFMWADVEDGIEEIGVILEMLLIDDLILELVTA